MTSEEQTDAHIDRLTGIMVGMERVAELVLGYKNKMIGFGFSPESAEAMAVEFHKRVLDTFAARNKLAPRNRADRRKK